MHSHVNYLDILYQHSMAKIRHVTMFIIASCVLFAVVHIITNSRGARWSKWTPRAIFGCPVVF